MMNQPGYGGFGGPPDPYNQPQFRPHPYPPQRSNNTTLIIVLVAVFVGLPIVGVLAAGGIGFYVARQNIGGRNGDMTTVPKRIADSLDCKKKCRVTSIATYNGGFTVTIPSNDVPGRTLTYRIEPIGGSSLMFSTDLEGGRPTFDPNTDVDWTVVSKALDDANRSALAGREADTMTISPCSYTQKPNEHGDVCIRISVLTKKGNDDLVYNAMTGARHEGS